MTSDELEKFGIPKVTSNLTRAIYSHDIEMTRLAAITMVSEGKLYCETYFNYSLDMDGISGWSRPILVINKKEKFGIIIIPWYIDDPAHDDPANNDPIRTPEYIVFLLRWEETKENLRLKNAEIIYI